MFEYFKNSIFVIFNYIKYFMVEIKIVQEKYI